MLIIEVNVPKDSLGPECRQALAMRLTARYLLEGWTTDPGALALYESLTHVLVREQDVWVAGGEPVAAEPRYLVNVSTGSGGADFADHLITSITRCIGEFEDDPGRPLWEPDVVVQVFELPDGHYGVYGRSLSPRTFQDMVADASLDAAGY